MQRTRYYQNGLVAVAVDVLDHICGYTLVTPMNKKNTEKANQEAPKDWYVIHVTQSARVSQKQDELYIRNHEGNVPFQFSRK